MNKAFALVLVVAACATDPTDDTLDEQAVTGTYGVDYSFARPNPATTRAQGYTFVVRYLSSVPSKRIDAAEAHAAMAAGLDIALNWEDSATAALGGFSQGAADAHAAAAQAAAAGMPAGRPIYFSIDFDASASQQGALDAYFDGVASVVGRNATGAYGGYQQIKRLFDAGKITWGWQTYAWSYGAWDPRAQLRQVQNGIANDTEDLDEAVAADFGQWGPNAPGPTMPEPKGYAGITPTADGGGYWIVKVDGGVFSFGDAHFYGSAGGQALAKPPIAIGATGDGGGYFLAATDGGIFTYGDAAFHGSMGGHHLNAPIVGFARDASSQGYWLVAADGGVFTFGNAGFYGSTGGHALNAPIVGMAATPTGHGYWLVASDGGVFTFGDAHFYGSMGGHTLVAPVSGIAARPQGDGYWLVARDGGVFTFGAAPYHGRPQ